MHTQNTTAEKENTTRQAKWVLRWGIHAHTLMSRDDGEPKNLNSLLECQEKAEALEKNFARMGYTLWYAIARSPSGKDYHLVENPNYSR